MASHLVSFEHISMKLKHADEIKSYLLRIG